jgi:hypothetical protein
MNGNKQSRVDRLTLRRSGLDRIAAKSYGQPPPVGRRVVTSPTTRQLKDIAAGFDVDIDVVRGAIDKAARGSTKAQAFMRLRAVRRGLAQELGGEEMLKVWSHREIPALGNARPAEILANGKVGVLERVQKVLKSGVFS